MIVRPLLGRATGISSPRLGLENVYDPSTNLQQTPLDPSQPRKTAHIMVLKDLEHGHSLNDFVPYLSIEE